MTKPSYEERRITKHSGSPQIADSARGDKSSTAAKEIRCANCNQPIVYFGESAMWWHVENPADCYRECFRKPGLVKATPKEAVNERR